MGNSGQESTFRVRVAHLEDLELYLAYSRAAQQRIRERGLAQYVPAAHEPYREAMRRRIEQGTLFAADGQSELAGEHAPMTANDSPAAFFNLERSRSSWWNEDGVPAAYLAGMVVAPTWSGRGVGRWVVAWCLTTAADWDCAALRLDCHAGNAWLRGYYESLGFQLRGYVAMQPGYDGCLYERVIVPRATSKLDHV